MLEGKLVIKIARVLAVVLLASIAVVACKYADLPPLSTGDGSVDAPGGCTGTAKQCGANDALYQCNESSGQLTKVQDCAHGCSVDHCNACEANTTFCSGDDLVMCDAGGNITNPMTCSKGCQSNKCNMCVPSTSTCDANGNAVACGLDGTPGTPQACGANGCISGICNSCTPNTVTCNGDTLVTCGSNGMIQATSSCTFGCASGATSHCKVFTPSYGIPVPTGTQTDLVINGYGTMDISDCANSNVALSVYDPTTQMSTNSALTSPQVSAVAQTGGSTICVVRFKHLTIGAGYQLSVVNGSSNNVLSLEATDDITVDGTIVFSNQSPGPSPGTMAYTVMGINTPANAPGAGGAGGARAGGTGGACTGCTTPSPGSSGGSAITNIRAVLSPGSVGGRVFQDDGGSLKFTRGAGGAGGGAVHLLSMTKVIVSSTGKLVMNGSGAPGQANSRSLGGGGGSGGAIVIEAPAVTFSSNALAVANGGGGAGGCQTCTGDFIPQCVSYPGEDGQLSATQAAGGNCNGPGTGGWESSNALFANSPNGINGNGASDVGGGGGGGSTGFIFLRGKTGANVMTSGAVISPAPTIEGVTAN